MVSSWLLLIMLLMVVSHAQACANMSSWDALEAVANGIPFVRGMIPRKESYASYLWNSYKRSTRLQRLRIVNEMSETLKEIAFRDARLDMIGVILFGPRKGRSILRASGDHGYEKLHVGEDFSQCFRNTDDLFNKHCGRTTSNGLRHIHSFSNICHYVEEMVMIEDAIMATCGSKNLAPYVIVDVENPIADVAPAPIHGSSVYCGRVYVNGISRMNLQSYAQTYRLAFEPLPHSLHHKIQVCFHRNASLGLCQCEKDSWGHIQKWSRDTFTSPYEKKFVDVKFANAAFGSVTIILVKVPLLQPLHYVFLAAGAGLLSISNHKDMLNQIVGIDSNVSKWVMRLVGVIAIHESSLDTPLAMVALAFCLALNSVVTSIIAPTELLPWIKLRKLLMQDEYADEYVAEWGTSAHEFREWVINNPHRIKRDTSYFSMFMTRISV